MVRFTEDVRSLSDLKTKGAQLIDKVVRTRRPTLITRRGKGVAVLIEVSEFERLQDQIEFRGAVEEGLRDEREGRMLNHAEAEKIFAELGAAPRRGKTKR